MKILEKRIPPPLVAILFGFLMKLLSCCNLAIEIPMSLKILVCSCLIVLALIIDISAIISFRKFRTTINPLNPSAATKLVVNGVYKFSRNPMYLGMVLFLRARGFYLGALLTLLIIPVFIFYITHFQIIPEEKSLQKIFENDFLDYKSKVNRWI